MSNDLPDTEPPPNAPDEPKLTWKRVEELDGEIVFAIALPRGYDGPVDNLGMQVICDGDIVLYDVDLIDFSPSGDTEIGNMWHVGVRSVHVHRGDFAVRVVAREGFTGPVPQPSFLFASLPLDALALLCTGVRRFFFSRIQGSCSATGDRCVAGYGLCPTCGS